MSKMVILFNIAWCSHKDYISVQPLALTTPANQLAIRWLLYLLEVLLSVWIIVNLPSHTICSKLKIHFFQANVFRYNINNTSFINWDLYVKRQMLYFGIPLTYPIESKLLPFCNWWRMSTGDITDICTKHFHLCVRITGDQVCTLEDTLSQDSQPHKRKLQILLATNSHSLQI